MDWLANLLALGHVRRVDGVFVLRYAATSIIAWCTLIGLALALALLCWLVARRVAHRQPAAPSGAVLWWIACGGLAVWALGLAAIVMPDILRHEVRISDAELTQPTGLWYAGRVRTFRLKEISAIFRSTEPGKFERRAVWSVERWGGRRERFEPGDLIARNAELVVAELRARNVLVIPGPSEERPRLDRPSGLLIIQVVAGVLALLLFLFRRPIGRWSRPAVRRLMRIILPRGFAWMPSGGPGIGKCPRCGAAISCSRYIRGGVAFACPRCGETATWQSASWVPPAEPDKRA